MKNLLSLICVVACSASAQETVGFQFERGAATPKALLDLFRAEAAKAKPVVFKFSYANALPAVHLKDEAPPQDVPAAESGFIDQFKSIESDLLAADQAYQNAPSGSDDATAAAAARQQAADRGAALAENGQWLQAYATDDIEAFTKDCASKYQSAASGSAVESFYKQFIPLGWQAYEGRATSDLQYIGHWRKVVDWAAWADSRYQAAASGSDEETAFHHLRGAAWERAPKVLQAQLDAAFGSYRAFEKMADEFESAYQAAASGSQPETFYKDARVQAYDAAFREVQSALSANHDQATLAQLDQEYDGRASSASAGSPAADYCGKVRDLVRKYEQGQ